VLSVVLVHVAEGRQDAALAVKARHSTKLPSQRLETEANKREEEKEEDKMK